MKTLKYGIYLLQFFLLLNAGMAQKQLPVSVDRPMAAAGRFYPSDPEELRGELKSLFLDAEKKTVSNLRAIIVPHAGYPFSGKVAASAYNQIDADHEYENIFLIGSSHSQLFDGASIYSVGDYFTPLGKIPVNREIASEIISKNPVFSYIPAADENEHSLEVQMPFLQYHMKKSFRIVPIIIGTQSEETCRNIAKALLPYFNETNLFIISSDFSHYPSQENAQKTDKMTESAIVLNSPSKFLETLHQESLKNIPDLATSACGWTSLLTLLYMTSDEPGFRYQPLIYRNSGDVPGTGTANVVGYWAIAVVRNSPSETSGWLSPTKEEEEKMLHLARSSIDEYLKTGKPVRYQLADGNALLRKNYGAFVTLYKKGELRGCIGRMTSDKPLASLIPEMAIASATEDPRFPPVTAAEMKDINIEISILSPLKKIKSPEEVIVGKHGVLVRKNGREGTLLPQVAGQFHWNREELLGHCSSEKAGIGWDGWKTGEVFIYEAAVFGEPETNGNIN